jgi:hypothetical protein
MDSSFCSLAFAFQMGKSTISSTVLETGQIIWEELVQEYKPLHITQSCCKV